MGLKCGIIGLTNVGKSMIFNCFSNTKAEVTNFSFSTDKSNLGTVQVPDPRLQALYDIQPSERIIQTVMDIMDLPGLAKGSAQGEGIGNKFLGDLRNNDAVIHVLRCFDDANLPHIEGSVNPVRDKEIVDFELIVKDLESIDKKLDKVTRAAKTGDKDAKRGQEILTKYKTHLENFQPARTLETDESEKDYVKDLFLLTTKPVLYVCNVDDASAATGNKYTKAVQDALKNEKAEIIIIAAKLESDIAELDNEDERLEFLADAGLSEPGVNKLIRAAYKLLDLETFFTVGVKEIRAWTIYRGSTAPEAAGVIHSDLQRGFIRAEVIKYDDYIALRSEVKCKEAGKLKLEGKTYVVQDGDLLNIRFNV